MQREGTMFIFHTTVQMLQLLCMLCCTNVVSTGYAMDVEKCILHSNARRHAGSTLNDDLLKKGIQEITCNRTGTPSPTSDRMIQANSVAKQGLVSRNMFISSS